MKSAIDLEAVIAQTRSFAAAIPDFAPAELVDMAAKELNLEAFGPMERARVIAVIQKDSMPVDKERKRWRLRGTKRHRIVSKSDFVDTIEKSSGVKMSEDFETALKGVGDYNPEIVQANLGDDSDLDLLRKQQKMLDRIGPEAPAYDLMPAINSRLDVAAKRERTKEILSGGFVGRVDELKAIRKFLYEPQEKAPLKCIYISGMPGAGKSYLLEECVKRAWEVTPKPIVLRLDFDRRSLNPFQPINVILELASQLVEELPEHASRIEDLRRELVRDEALRPSYSTGFALAPSLGKAMCNAINASSRPVLIVLDTLEVLRGYGESHPGDLFDFLDRFCRMGMRPISILAGGRDSVASLLSNPKSRRIATHLPLDNLIEEEAVLLLERRDCPPERAADIFARVGGNPLLLQLTHEASKDDPGLLDQLPTDKAPEFIGAYLYRAILSRIDDPLLERIAQPCLILSEITSDLISNVIGPAIEGEVIEAERAEQLLDELKSHHWLVKEEPGTGAITHHLDVRGQLLPMIYKEIPIQARDVNAEAAEWYELRGEEMLAAYHRLQLSRDDGDPAMPDVEIAWQFRDDLIDELPQEAADELRQLRGERSSVARKASSSREPDVKATPRTNEPDKSAVKELMLALERGDLSEAALIHANAFPRRCKPGTQAAVAQLNFWWFAGFWSHARKCVGDGPVLEVDGLPEEGGDLSALVSLEMQAESDFSQLARAFGREGQSEFLRRAQQVYLHGKLLRLDQGPLAYAMLCDDRPSPISGGYFEALGTAGLGLDDKGHALGFGLQDAERVLRKCGLEPIDPHGDIGPWAFGDVSPERAVHAHMLSLLNPYLKPISALIHQSQSEILKGSLHNLAERSVQLPRVWSRDVTQDDWREQSSHDLGSLVEWIGALGLTSDWTGALTFFRPLHHLTWLAKAAERWRRTSAGNWSYGSVKPMDWHDQPGPLADLGLVTWVNQLITHPSPRNAALEQLHFWATLSVPWEDGIPMDARGRLLSLARKGLRKADPDAHLMDLLTNILRSMQRHKEPRAIIAPLAVLLAEVVQDVGSGEEVLASLSAALSPD